MPFENSVPIPVPPPSDFDRPHLSPMFVSLGRWEKGSHSVKARFHAQGHEMFIAI
jgi:hypothetical protein